MSAPKSPSAEELLSFGLNPSWSRRVTFLNTAGTPVDWHVLDTGAGPLGTLVCVHGNPTWSYLFKDVLTTLAPGWRVIAVDQSGMGYSERNHPRRLSERIDELVQFCRQEVCGPVVLVAHDWGGPVAVGAAGHLNVQALILANTAVAKPEGVEVPPLIKAARALVDFSCRRTPMFVRGTAAMTTKEHRKALNAPYRSADRREAVRDFVADIPLGPDDPSAEALALVGTTFDQLTCPILLIWGGKDPVFHDRFLSDLRRRQPSASIERHPNSGHLVLLDGAVGPVIAQWLNLQASGLPADASDTLNDQLVDETVFSSLTRHSSDTSTIYRGPDGSLTWEDLGRRAEKASKVLAMGGLRPGDRVALLVPPSPDLLVAAAAVWRCGGVLAVVDPSGGLWSIRRLLRAQAPRMVIGTRRTLLGDRLFRFTPGSIAAGFGVRGVALDLDASIDAALPMVGLHREDLAAIVHTSGATGPAKAVRYTHGALTSQREALRALVQPEPDQVFTTSFAAFLLLAPVLEMSCVRPDIPIDQPSALGFDELFAASDGGPIGTAWLSPASARQLTKTAAGRSIAIGRTLLAGAPIPAPLAHSVKEITGGLVLAPYGMTECLPITGGEDPELIGPSGGTSVGFPVDGCTVKVVSLSDPRQALGDGQWGEILVNAPWMFAGYDGAWTKSEASTLDLDGISFHRTGDVGYFNEGRLYILGRLAHVLSTKDGPRASVAIEGPIATALGCEVAAVGVGPEGLQVVTVVLNTQGKLRLAEPNLALEARRVSNVPLAAVLEGTLPVDHRHQSKVDRTVLRDLVATFLEGR